MCSYDLWERSEYLQELNVERRKDVKEKEVPRWGAIAPVCFILVVRSVLPKPDTADDHLPLGNKVR